MRIFLPGAFFLFFFFFISAYAQAQSAPAFDWVKSAGSAGDDVAIKITTDPTGNSYVLGYYQDSIRLGSILLTGGGQLEMFLAKYDPAGNVIWAHRAGLPNGAEFPRDIFLDQAGNIYITGAFGLTAHFGNLTITATPGSVDVFIAKYDSNGNAVLAKKIGGTAWETGNSISADADGNIYVTGEFKNGIMTIGSASYHVVSNDATEAFTVKMDSTGNVLWSARIGGPNSASDKGKGIGTDAAGNVYVTGIFDQNTVFGTQTIYGRDNMFLVKYSPSGAQLWVRTAGDPSAFGDDIGNDLIVKPNGDCFIVGQFHNQVNFGSTSLTAVGNGDIFVAKYNAAGTALWAKRAGGLNNWDHDAGYAIATDNAGNIYITGTFGNTGSFGNTTLRSDGIYDVFAAKLDPFGNFIWAKQGGGVYEDFSWGIGVDGNGNAFIAGQYKKSADFGGIQVNGAPPIQSSSIYKYDMFVAKIGTTLIPCIIPGVSMSGTCAGNNQTLTFTLTGQQPWRIYYTKDGIQEVFYTAASPYTVTVPNGNYALTGVASGNCYAPASGWLVPVPQIIAGSPKCPGPQTLAASGAGPGQSYAWYLTNSITVPFTGSAATFTTPSLTGTTTYYVAIVDAGGCIGARVPVQATVIQLPNVSAGINRGVCSNMPPFQLTGYTPLGGTWSGTGITPSGLYTPSAGLVGQHPLTYSYTQSGCTKSSVAYMNVYPVTATPAIVTIAPDTLMSTVVGGNTYEWKRNGTVIAPTTRKIRATVSGTYSVRVKNLSGCFSDPSQNHVFVVSAVKELAGDEVKVYPNPTSGMLQIKLQHAGTSEIVVMNLLGQTVMSRKSNLTTIGEPLVLNLSGLAKTIYLIQIKTGKGTFVKKIIIE